MDLQLGLAISRNSTKGFDLNSSEVIDSKEQCCCNLKRRSFDEAFEEKNADDLHHVPQTLPLLLWNDQPNQGEDNQDDDDDDDDLDNSSMVTTNKIERNTNGLVGWPPINPLRKRICHQNSRGNIGINCVTVENGGNGTAAAVNRAQNSLYVKVKMEGVGIARKIDLSLHHSSHTLLQTLLAMFGKCEESFHSYLLSFQDKEGDWQFANDVPWSVFIGSVQRLKLQRKSN